MVLGYLVALQAIEIVSSEFFVLEVSFQEIVDHCQDRVRDGYKCSLLAPATRQSTELSLEVGVFSVDGCPGDLYERTVQPTIPAPSCSLFRLPALSLFSAA